MVERAYGVGDGEMRCEMESQQQDVASALNSPKCTSTRTLQAGLNRLVPARGGHVVSATDLKLEQEFCDSQQPRPRH
jgi:hypothetical protein